MLLGAEHHQHALLAFGEHHLVGGHARLARRHLVEVERDAEIALRPHLDRRAGEARGAHVLNRDDGAGLHQLQACFEQPLLGERIADLHCRALLLDAMVELRRRHRRAADTVAPGLGAEIDDRKPDTFRLRSEDRVLLCDAEGKRVDQAIAVVAAMEIHLAADSGDSKGIAVAADAGDDAGHEMARARMFRIAEAERVQRRDRPRAHGEDVAKDAADAGRSTLIRLDVGGVVVALHLEDGDEPLADVDHAGILARPLDHHHAFSRQRSEPFLRALVGAVLVPHGGEDAELRQRRLAADQVEDALVLVGLQPVLCDERGRDRRIVSEHPVSSRVRRRSSA